MPRLSKPTARRQGQLISPQFRDLVAAFDAKRARLGADVPDEVDPELVVVFDLAGSVQAFHNAIKNVPGLEFLSELVGDSAEPDEDFHMVEQGGERTHSQVQHSLYLVLSNRKAIDELVRLFDLWQQDQSIKFEDGLGRFKTAFEQLTAIRRWGPEDRILALEGARLAAAAALAS